MKKTIAVLPGDGIGPEIMDATLMVLDVIARKFGHEFEYKKGLIGGAAYDEYHEHLPQETLDLAANSDAILFGSVGGPVDSQNNPKWKGAEKAAVLGIRKHFDFNINVRPSIVWPSLKNKSVLKSEIIGDGFSLIVVRELSGGIYFGDHVTQENHAYDVMQYDKDTIARIASFAFKTAMKRSKRLTSVDKANVLDSSVLWRKVVEEVAKGYPEVELNHLYVDNAAMQLVQNPRQFDVIVTGNMFGDILSDLSSVLPGSLGLLGSASFNAEGFGLYEPSGGSAPDIAGKGIANPVGMLLSAALMLRHSFGMLEEAGLLEQSIQRILEKYRTGDVFEVGCEKVGTEEFSELICAQFN